MKALFVVIVIACLTIGFILGAAVSNQTPIYQGLLQSDLDCGGHSPTNALSVSLSGTTNQVIFGATNTAPVTTATPATWISVQVAGSNNVYRLPLYQ